MKEVQEKNSEIIVTEKTTKKNSGRRARKAIKNVKLVLRHLFLVVMSIIWLTPIAWIVLNSFSTQKGINIRRFVPKKFTLNNYKELLFGSDTVSMFPTWFKNTLIIAIFTCIISTCFVLMVAYAMSCMRFKSRKTLMNLSVTINLFPGILAMIAVYFVLKSMALTDSHMGLVLVYSGSAGLGYLIAKGFFDTVPDTLREAARIDGASEARIFFKIVIPMSKPIIVYTIISSFLVPWADFVYARLILHSGLAKDMTVSIGLYEMLTKTLINDYFAQFCAGGIIVSIPISILFIIMQKFYVEGITGGAVKG